MLSKYSTIFFPLKKVYFKIQCVLSVAQPMELHFLLIKFLMFYWVEIIMLPTYLNSPTNALFFLFAYKVNSLTLHVLFSSYVFDDIHRMDFLYTETQLIFIKQKSSSTLLSLLPDRRILLPAWYFPASSLHWASVPQFLVIGHLVLGLRVGKRSHGGSRHPDQLKLKVDLCCMVLMQTYGSFIIL